MNSTSSVPSLNGKSPLAIVGLMVLTGLLWGSGFPLIKMLDGAFPPITLAALRGLIGASALILWFLAIGEDIIPRSRREILDWIALGTLNGWLANVLVNYAIQTMPAGQASMIQASGPLITALLASQLFADERLTPRRLLGIALGIIGVALLVWPRLSGSGATALAALAMLGTAVSYSLANIYVRWLPVADPRRLALGQQVFSGLFASLIALFTTGAGSFAAFGTQYPLVLFLGLVSTAMPIVMFMFIIRAAGPTRAAMLGYIVPVWALVLSAILLGETLTLREIAAGFIILGGVYLVSMSRGRS
ncbi:MAG: DMT family transporter [Proteobacteria bacterium]|nr:DMT family transporter [Pseudomonadota bacterium]